MGEKLGRIIKEKEQPTDVVMPDDRTPAQLLMENQNAVIGAMNDPYPQPAQNCPPPMQYPQYPNQGYPPVQQPSPVWNPAYPYNQNPQFPPQAPRPAVNAKPAVLGRLFKQEQVTENSREFILLTIAVDAKCRFSMGSMMVSQ